MYFRDINIMKEMPAMHVCVLAMKSFSLLDIQCHKIHSTAFKVSFLNEKTNIVKQNFK